MNAPIILWYMEHLCYLLLGLQEGVAHAPVSHIDPRPGLLPVPRVTDAHLAAEVGHGPHDEVADAELPDRLEAPGGHHGDLDAALRRLEVGGHDVAGAEVFRDGRGRVGAVEVNQEGL